MLHKKRKWSLGVLLLAAFGLILGLASLANSQGVSKMQQATPQWKSQHAPAADPDWVPEQAVPNDECTQAADIYPEVPVWIWPQPMASVRSQNTMNATDNFSTDQWTCDVQTCYEAEHYHSVWFRYLADEAGVLYITTYDPMFTRGGVHEDSGDTHRTNYDTLITVFSTENGNDCQTFQSDDWVVGPHNDQFDRAFYYNTDYDCTGAIMPMDTVNPFPQPYGSSRERGANDLFWPGMNFAGVDKNFAAVAVEVIPGVTYKFMVQHYYFDALYPRELVLDSSFIPGKPAHSDPGISSQNVAVSLAANGQIWNNMHIPNGFWLANYHVSGNVGEPMLDFPDFAYDPFNTAYFFWDDENFVYPAGQISEPFALRTDPNRKAEHFWADKNFFAAADAADPLNDFEAYGFASRVAVSQMHDYATEYMQEQAAGVPSGFRMNRWYVGSRAVDNDMLNPIDGFNGYAYTFDDYTNSYAWTYTSSAQNDCNTGWTPTEASYLFLSETAGPVAAVAVKAPAQNVTPLQYGHGASWLFDRTPIWTRPLMPTANVGGDILSGEIAVFFGNETMIAAPGIDPAMIGPWIKYIYDEDDVAAPCTHGNSNPGDTGPTFGFMQYLQNVVSIADGITPDPDLQAIDTILAATVGLDDVLTGYDCTFPGAWNVANTGRAVPDNTNTADPMIRYSNVLYFIDQMGRLWAVRDHVWEGADDIANGMPDLRWSENYELVLDVGIGGTGWDLVNTVYMTYNATRGELLVALHGTGLAMAGPTDFAQNGSKIIVVNDLNTPPGYRGLQIHDPASIDGTDARVLMYNHENVDAFADHDYVWNFDNTTGIGTSGPPEAYDDPHPSTGVLNPYSNDIYRPTFNAGMTVGPTLPYYDDATNTWTMPADTMHIYGIAGRDDYSPTFFVEPDPVQKGGADPNYWMTHILDFYSGALDPASDASHQGDGMFPHIQGNAWPLEPGNDYYLDQLNTWAQDLPYDSRCEGFFHGMTGLDFFHDNSRPDVWFNGYDPISVGAAGTTCVSCRTCEFMNHYRWCTQVVLDWNSWDFVGTGVVGYDGYLFVYTNTTLPCTDPNAWTVETIFDETEVVGADHLHVGAQHASQTFTYTLPCRYTGEAFIRLVAYDREGNTSFVETPAFYIGVNSVITSDLNELAGQVVHRLDPDQPHRVIPVQWWYTPDPCLVGDEPGRIEFDITFDGGYSWQCMHVLNDAENDWSPVTDGEEILAQGIHPQTGSQFMVDLDGNGTEETHYCTLDLVIPDYYCDRYPYEYQVSIRLYWRQHGVGTCCEDIERLIIEQSPDFSIADELGPTIVMDDCPVAGTILPGQKLDITWQAKELNPVDYPGFRSWFPIGDSCDGNLIINTDGYGLPVVQAWFSTDAFDNWATTSYDITLVDVATGEPYTVYNGLAGNATHYEWQIPIDFPQATYDLWITGHDDYGNSSYFTPNPQWAGDIQHELFLSAGSCQFDIGDLTAPEVTITSPMDGTHYDPGVVANITWTAEDDVAVTEQFVTIVGPSYSELFDAATSSFNWSIPDDAEVGTYTITVYAKDAAGHIGTDSITIIIDDIVDPWFTTDFTGTGTACLGGSEVYTWVTADNVGVTMQMLHVMGPGFDVEIALGAADTSYTWNLASDLQVGNYTATLMAYDAAGNMGQQSAVTVVSDCTNPTVTGMTASPSTIIPGGSVAFAWTSSDNLALVSQTLQVAGPGYDNTFALPADASSYSLSFPSTADLGSYTATLRAYDDAGNVGMATANFTIADNEAPVVAISTPSTGMTLDAGSMVNITWTATDNVGVANQWVTINGTNYNTAISSYAWAVPEEVGSYAIQVHAVDDAGHQGDSAQITVDVVEFPMITVAHKKSNPFRIQLFGSDFQPNCTVTINGSAVSYKFKNSGKLLLKNVKSLCPKGVAVTIQVHNPDLGYSNEFEFMR